MDKLKCKKILKEDNKVYIIDSEETKLDLTNISEVNKYESRYRVNVKDILNQFFKSESIKGYGVLEDLEKLIDEYKIDSFVCADMGVYDPNINMIVYTIKNREAYLDCQLKVFYSENKELEFIVEFSIGAAGIVSGISLFKCFKEEQYVFIRPLIKKYFMLNNDGVGEIEIIKNLYSDIEESINRYYE